MRHSSCCGLLLLALGLVVSFGCESRQRTDEPQRLGLLVEPGDANDVGYAVNWLADLDLPRNQRIASVTVVDDLIIAFERPTNMVTATSVSDGETQWRSVVASGGDPLLGVTRDGNELHINSSTHLYTVDARNGEQLGVIELPEVVDAGHARVDDRLVFGSMHGKVYGIDPATGQVRWTHQVNGRVGVDPTVSGDSVIVVDDTGRYAAYRAADGELRWYGRTFDRISATPAVDRDGVYIASRDQVLYAVNPANGRDLWAYRETSELSIDPTIIGDTLLLTVPREGRMVAITTETGEARWGVDAIALALPARQSENVLFVTQEGLHLLRLADGAVLAETHTQPLSTALAGPDDSVVLVGGDGRMLRLNPRR